MSRLVDAIHKEIKILQQLASESRQDQLHHESMARSFRDAETNAKKEILALQNCLKELGVAVDD